MDPKVQEMAEALRHEPYNLFTNNCVLKSKRLVKACHAWDIDASLVICLGMAKAVLFNWRFALPLIHAWAEVKDCRVETSRPLEDAAILGIVPSEIKPIASIKFGGQPKKGKKDKIKNPLKISRFRG